MLRLIEELSAEHALIDAMLGSLRTYVQRRVRDGLGPADAPAYLDFFVRYAGDFHHAREEEVLLLALVREVGLPKERGPIAIIEAEHRELAGLLHALAPLLVATELTATQAATLEDLAVRYSRGLWHHIDAESSVLFPESAERLRTCGVGELVGRPATDAELAARARAQELLQRHPSLYDHDAFRGDGCALCPAYGVRCEGIEREWWTEAEWEALDERAGSFDG